ncbi:MAG TPA: molybdopterin cofactor-binding domain-containing protein [Phenylobacterium sp.]|uniref:xanthine dehydrogenase family protein molybdopterin-binding subunit n=1 Tax=Phenylobacterium sp. TaxID=1871053 RepID=UPI002C44CFE7|nr:molybdopterin cofactor-binding domain-containing protein [Phenylobacterium sp.]HSV04215.1 molybdopterin cofactor-binding domain-containing protein [Phenylobacterium sp.]
MLPPSLQKTPSLARWVSFRPDRKVGLNVGKVEFGQGVATALTQIAAEELDLAPEQVAITFGDTERAPDEGLTVGSMSIEVSGASVRLVCADVRRRFLGVAAERLGCQAGDLGVDEGAIRRGRQSTGLDYWALADAVDLDAPVAEDAPLKDPAAYRVVGRSTPRIDLPSKLAGGGFITDLRPAGLLHARVLRQPSPAARLQRLDEAAIRSAARGEVDILRDGDFVAVLAASESAAERAVAAAEAVAVWDDPRRISPEQQEAPWLRSQPTEDNVLGEPQAPAQGVRQHRATYAKPYISHASMGPSVGLAQYAAGRLTVWSHTQGPYPLRDRIARAAGLAAEQVTLRHAQGSGCYGHNGADDAAFDAALIALRRPGPPIRVQWRREDEFGFEPVGTAMIVELAAELDEAGRPASWTCEIWSGPHGNRGRLLAETALPGAAEAPPVRPPSNRMFSGAVRNAPPSYDIPRWGVIDHLVRETPVYCSSLRTLGALQNVFAAEGFVDELAALAGEDPLAYRLSLTSDPRARAVIETAAEMAGWARRDGRALGIGYARYKNTGAYIAVIAQVEAAESVRLKRIWCAGDIGLVINPDGARNQIEGGILMAASWCLKEQVRFDERGIASRTFGDYPMLRFSEVPPVEVRLIEQADAASVGIGEASSGPAAGAIGNAVAAALGVRVRELPFTRERLASAILAA